MKNLYKVISTLVLVSLIGVVPLYRAWALPCCDATVPAPMDSPALDVSGCTGSGGCFEKTGSTEMVCKTSLVSFSSKCKPGAPAPATWTQRNGNCSCGAGVCSCVGPWGTPFPGSSQTGQTAVNDPCTSG
jgi:hypothetical protein